MKTTAIIVIGCLAITSSVLMLEGINNTYQPEKLELVKSEYHYLLDLVKADADYHDSEGDTIKADEIYKIHRKIKKELTK